MTVTTINQKEIYASHRKILRDRDPDVNRPDVRNALPRLLWRLRAGHRPEPSSGDPGRGSAVGAGVGAGLGGALPKRVALCPDNCLKYTKFLAPATGALNMGL